MIILVIHNPYQQQYDLSKQRWEISDRESICYERKRITQYISKPVYRKEVRKQDLIIKMRKSQQYQKYINKTFLLPSWHLWKILKEDKKLIRSNYYLFFDIIYDLRGRTQFNSKIDFINYILANSFLLEDLISEYFSSLKRYIFQDSIRIINFKEFNSKHFQAFCYRSLSVKPIIKYENIQEPENFHIITKDDHIYFESEESYKLFLKDLENARFDKNLANFYSQRNHKIKSKIK